ncbi:hypothetical protein BIW11_06460 [Tropilaelaps mercedesae]|uniref:Uncharacterized protein n=1 Tax=Tropilaelaps mercedesae TaxID=418985 RepID=A0A1V9XY54_9ACAR|nr:hypothetical protein BIW11_06460 [Tropilaelaps mercedesae]
MKSLFKGSDGRRRSDLQSKSRGSPGNRISSKLRKSSESDTNQVLSQSMQSDETSKSWMPKILPKLKSKLKAFKKKSESSSSEEQNYGTTSQDTARASPPMIAESLSSREPSKNGHGICFYILILTICILFAACIYNMYARMDLINNLLRKY